MARPPCCISNWWSADQSKEAGGVPAGSLPHFRVSVLAGSALQVASFPLPAVCSWETETDSSSPWFFRSCQVAAVSFPLARSCFCAGALRARGVREPRSAARQIRRAPGPAGLCASRSLPLAPARELGSAGLRKGIERSDSPRSGEHRRCEACVPSAWQFFCHERGLDGFISKLQFSLCQMCTFFALTCGDFEFDSP